MKRFEPNAAHCRNQTRIKYFGDTVTVEGKFALRITFIAVMAETISNDGLRIECFNFDHACELYSYTCGVIFILIGGTFLYQFSVAAQVQVSIRKEAQDDFRELKGRSRKEVS